MTYYDRQGRPIPRDEWITFVGARREEYRRVAADQLGDVWISTVWLGLDHGLRQGGPPLIFETMIFPECEYCERTSTEAAALAAHDRAVAHVRTGAYARECREAAE